MPPTTTVFQAGDLALRKVRSANGPWIPGQPFKVQDRTMVVEILHQSHWGYYLVQHPGGAEELVPPDRLIKLTYPY